MRIEGPFDAQGPLCGTLPGTEPLRSPRLCGEVFGCGRAALWLNTAMRLLVLLLTMHLAFHQTDPAAKPQGRRQPAEVMDARGAGWLVRPEREEEEKPEQTLDALKIRPGDVVADVGAGVGYFSLRLARRVGE